ncbi:hypothetical protein BJX99DRAFT_221703 [Aspergillus californicus]
MPFDENGVKWSCEPCIRGHRSSKCAHFDRLMVSVGKAGRPLSKCPHVEGSCNCKKLCAFMVAIPKDTGCLCRPVYKVLLDENGPTPAVSKLPVDLTTGSGPSSSPSKVQKVGKRNAKPTPELVNRALSSLPQIHQHVFQTETAHMNQFVPQSQMTGYTYNVANGALPHSNGFSAATNIPSGLGLPGHILTAGMCPPNQFQSSVQPNAPIQAQLPGSCCASREITEVNKAEQNAPSGFDALPLVASPMAEASPSTWSTYSNNNGHFSPLNGTPHAYQSAFADYSHQSPNKVLTNPGDIGFDHVPALQPGLAGAPELRHHSTATDTNGTSHSCSCGPNCQCYACPDHPYNDVTVKHVAEIGRFIAQDPQAIDDGNIHQNAHLAENGFNDPPLGRDFVTPEHLMKTGFDPMPAEQCCGTDGEVISDGHDAQPINTFATNPLMMPDAYYTYEYQIGLPGACAGEAGNCQCGPSCSCLGCLTHGNA